MKPADVPVDDSLIRALCDPGLYDHDVEAVRVIETHISWVLLTGRYAYKIKKPVRFPFVDFSTLHRRRVFCDEELRLNKRLAPELYLEVIPIDGTVEAPIIGSQPAIEYAVKQWEFPADARLDKRVEVGQVDVADIRALAAVIARFHESLSPSQSFGNPVAITRAALGNLAEVDRLTSGPRQLSDLTPIRDWMTRACVRLERAFTDRKAQGAIREGHGDLHLENLAVWDGCIVPFDALEFDPSLRWIDVMDEVAFLIMDLMVHGRADLAHEFLNRYLELTGDYAGLEVAKFYLIHRALVRAKVEIIKQSQRGGSAKAPANRPGAYLEFAQQRIPRSSPLLLITHGFSGSGKTTVSDQLVSRLPAIRCRSDLERKRAHGLPARAKSDSGLGSGLYSSDSTRETYDRLLRYAGWGLRAGFNILVDASFLRRDERDRFRHLAQRERAQFGILDCHAPEALLRQRIEARRAADSDVSEATLQVLDHQISTAEAFKGEESPFIVPVSTGDGMDCDALAQQIRTSLPLPRARDLPRSARPSSPSPAPDESPPFSGSRPGPSQ